MWDKFIIGFCKVEFLCYQWEPNWLGWTVLVWGAGFALLALMYLISLFLTPLP